MLSSLTSVQKSSVLIFSSVLLPTVPSSWYWHFVLCLGNFWGYTIFSSLQLLDLYCGFSWSVRKSWPDLHWGIFLQIYWSAAGLWWLSVNDLNGPRQRAKTRNRQAFYPSLRSFRRRQIGSSHRRRGWLYTTLWQAEFLLCQAIKILFYFFYLSFSYFVWRFYCTCKLKWRCWAYSGN